MRKAQSFITCKCSRRQALKLERKKHDYAHTEEVHRNELVAYDIPLLSLTCTRVFAYFLCLVNHKKKQNIVTASQIVLCPIIFS